MITKSFVALSVVIKIDDMFSASLPKDILENSIQLNKRNLRMPPDNNTFEKIFKRINYKNFHREVVNILINLWYEAIVNFQLIFFNYFSCIICIMA